MNLFWWAVIPASISFVVLFLIGNYLSTRKWEKERKALEDLWELHRGRPPNE